MRTDPAGRIVAMQIDPKPRSKAPFVLAIALSAFLLFCLEFLSARLVLPVFGGAPAVWTTTLFFFTTVLFLGYVYAHAIASRFSATGGGQIQAVVAIAMIVLTLMGPQDIAALRHVEMPAAINVLLALLVIAGPAAFLLASTTPLFSAWFAGEGRSPWWLYAVSNGASFAALIAYPFIIAPTITLSFQRLLLGVGLSGYLLMVIWALLLKRGTSEMVPPGSATAHQPVPARRQLLWLLAAAIPAGLMSATTMFITTDLVSAPLIWMGPLGVYLASFVVAFAERGRPIMRLFEWLTPAAATLMWLPFMWSGWPVLPLLLVENLALFVISVAIHGRLACDRPSEGHLTRFYLVISFGGLLATAFVALVAPISFSLIYEYPLLVAAGVLVLVLLPAPFLRPPRGILRNPLGAFIDLFRRLLPYGVVSLILYPSIPDKYEVTKWLLIFGSVAVALSVTPRRCAIVTIASIEFFIVVTSATPLLRERTFFGVTQVFETGSVHSLYSGSTLHGLQFTDGREGQAATYYVRTGPLGDIFKDMQNRMDSMAIGVVGLGVGTIAAYARPQDRLIFYEIDSAIIDIASDPRYFTFLENAPVEARIVEGDGRISLAQEPPQSLDLLILDAFSSDVVPAHLLTREAIETYRRALRPGGLIAFHISSRYYNLESAVEATARSAGLASAGKLSSIDSSRFENLGAMSSFWVVAGDAAQVASFRDEGWLALKTSGQVLSDDLSDLTRLLRIGHKTDTSIVISGQATADTSP